LIKCLSGGTQDVDPLESWGVNKGRFGQLGADGAVFLFEAEHIALGQWGGFLLFLSSKED
jgi:hypothetical protein